MIRRLFRPSRRRQACPQLAGLPVSRVALIDERLRWVSLDGLLVDLVPDSAGARTGFAIDDRDAERATEILCGATREPVRQQLTTVGGRQVEIDAVPVTHGSAPLVVGIVRDVEAERDRASLAPSVPDLQTAAELELSEDSFRAAFDDAPGAVALVVGPGEAGGRFLRVNAAFAELLGRSVEELALCEIAAVTHPDDRDLEAAVTGDDGSRTVRKRYLHSSGRAVHAQVRISEVRDAHGVVVYLVSHVVDLDAHAASQRALDDAARIRRDMVSTISHELRTPLTSVQGYLEMIAGEDFGELTSEQKRMIDIALRNAGRLEEFVADLMMLARLDAAELDPIRHLPIDLGSVVQAAVAEVAAASARRGQDLVVELPGEPVAVPGDAAHLTRAVQSLLANAVKYTADGGRITVAVRADGDAARISVADTGMGIARDEIAMLGNRFYRGSDAQRRAIGGTGLGLAIAKTIVERHHGRLEVDSRPGHGSTFTVVFDRRDGGAGGAGGA